MKKMIFSLLLCLVICGCDREADDLIGEPTETSTIITGYVRTPEGTPLVNIPVAFDYEVSGIFGTSVVHKAKGKTDKSGFYKIFFETTEKPGMGLSNGYTFSVDLSRLPQEEYMIAQKVEFWLSVDNSGKWTGSTINCTFFIPLKKLVKVTVTNDGLAVKEGKYAVKNIFQYYSGGDFMYDKQNVWDVEGAWSVFENVTVPENGSVSLMMPMAMGVENGVILVYLGGGTVGYPNGVPASEGEVIDVTGNYPSEIDLKYISPETSWE